MTFESRLYSHFTQSLSNESFVRNTHARFEVLPTLIIRQQYRQCTCNVTLRCIHETIVTVEKQKLLHTFVCVCARAKVGDSMRVRVCVRLCVWL